MEDLYEDLKTAIIGICGLVHENTSPKPYNAFWIDQPQRPKNFANVYLIDDGD